MKERFSFPVGAWYGNVFRFHVREVMKADGFKERIMHGGSNIISLCYFEKDSDIVSLTVTKETMDKSIIELHSETLPLKDIMLRSVINIINEVSDDFLMPVLPGEKVEEMKRAIHDAILAGE